MFFDSVLQFTQIISNPDELFCGFTKKVFGKAIFSQGKTDAATLLVTF